MSPWSSNGGLDFTPDCTPTQCSSVVQQELWEAPCLSTVSVIRNPQQATTALCSSQAPLCSGDIKQMGRRCSDETQCWGQPGACSNLQERISFSNTSIPSQNFGAIHGNGVKGGKVGAVLLHITLLCFWQGGFLLHPVTIIMSITDGFKEKMEIRKNVPLKSGFVLLEISFPSSISLLLSKRNYRSNYTGLWPCLCMHSCINFRSNS